MSQITTRFIADNAVVGSKIRLNNLEALRGRNAANTTDISIISVNASDNPEFQTLPWVNSSLPIPTSPKQLATLEYITNYVVGKQQAKNAAQVMSVTNIALTGAAPLIIDGVTMANAPAGSPNMRIALIGQTTASQNGIYDYTDNGTVYTLTRSFDFGGTPDPTGTEVSSGDYFRVEFGTIYSGYDVQLTTPNPITVGTTNLTFAYYPSTISLTAGDMLSKNNNVFSVDLASLSGLKSTNPGKVGGQLMVLTDTSVLVSDQSIRIDPTTGAVLSPKHKKYNYTLTAADIANQYVDLPNVASTLSVDFRVVGAPAQYEGTDYTVNYTGGTGSNTRCIFAGGLATGGASALIAGDAIEVAYRSY